MKIQNLDIFESFSSVKSKEIKHDKFNERRNKDKKKPKGKKDYSKERQRKYEGIV